MSFVNKLFGSKQPMDWKAFVHYYTDYAAQQLGQPVDIEWGDDMEQATIHLPNGQGGSMAGYLGNFYALYRQDPEDLDNIVARTFAALMESQNPNLPSDIQSHIFPMLKNREWVANYYDQIQKAYPDATAKDELLCIAMAGDLVATYALDLDNTLRYLTEKDLEEQQISMDDLLVLAAQNFSNYIEDNVSLAQLDDSAVVLLELDGVYNASLLLCVNNLLDAAELPFANDCICAVPARDALLACPPDDKVAIALMREIATEFAEESPYRVSNYLYRVKDGELILFDEMPTQH